MQPANKGRNAVRTVGRARDGQKISVRGQLDRREPDKASFFQFPRHQSIIQSYTLTINHRLHPDIRVRNNQRVLARLTRQVCRN